MAFCIKPDDASVAAAIRRITAEQIDKSLAAIEQEPRAEAVHEVRKRCKKIRGLVRFVRPSFPAYEVENAFFRDTARMVDSLRDAKVMQDTYDALVAQYGAQIDRNALGSVRAVFTRQRNTVRSDIDIDDRLAQCRGRMVEGRERSREWCLEADGFAAFRDGFAKTYKRARKAADKALPDGDATAHHEMRKRVKYHWMHVRMLRPLWPERIKARANLAKDLSDVLGDHHDLAVFLVPLNDDPEAFGSEADLAVMTGLARKRSQALSKRAAKMASRLLADKPDALLEHMHGLWKPWARRTGLA